MTLTVRRLERRDAAEWHSCWEGYLRFYRHELSPAVTEQTFERLCVGSDGMIGVVAVDDHGMLVGFAHVVFHGSTWTNEVYCYLEDLFVIEAARGTGAGHALIKAVYELADDRRAARVYWHTQEYNAPARSLYDRVAHRTSFVRYER